MEIEKWFYTPIWTELLVFDTQRVAKKCLHLKDSGYPNRNFSNDGGWQSKDIIPYQNPELKELFDLVEFKKDEVARIINPDLQLKLSNIWININERGNSNAKHIHPSCLIAGTIYIQTDENTGDIVFYNEHAPMRYFGFDMNSDILHKNVRYKPMNGLLILFPGWIPHAVEPSNSDQTRISISFNLHQHFET